MSPRSPSVADQRVKVEFEKLNVECGNLQVQCPKSDVGSENLKPGQTLNVGCEKKCSGLYIPLNLKIELENLTVAYEKLNVESENLNVECKKVESRV